MDTSAGVILIESNVGVDGPDEPELPQALRNNNPISARLEWVLYVKNADRNFILN
ncbi:MAG: hypothetical protein OEY11_01485 [Gammaproteobacteria bacterium]|nr:hypothetical protein [Gammaproteobacteria bacterium]